MLVNIVALLMVFGIPLSAIIGAYMLKLKRMELEAGGGGKGGDLARRVAQLESDNRDARARIEVLETIVTGDEPTVGTRARLRVDAATARSGPGSVAAHDGDLAATSASRPAAVRSKG